MHARIDAYEMAYRMQTSVPDLMDLGDEPQSTFDLYGPESRRSSFAANCLLARRMAERDVRFIQLFHRGWDQHKSINEALPAQCYDVDQASAALVTDLKNRGLLDERWSFGAASSGVPPILKGRSVRTARTRPSRSLLYDLMAGGGIKLDSTGAKPICGPTISRTRARIFETSTPRSSIASVLTTNVSHTSSTAQRLTGVEHSRRQGNLGVAE